MFARKVAVRLKPGALKEFVNLMEVEIVPWLRQQPGFVDLITLAAPDGSEVATISFWDEESNAQAYNSSGYAKSLTLLGELLDGTPYVKTFHVVSSTLQKVDSTQALASLEPKGVVADTGPIQLASRAHETMV